MNQFPFYQQPQMNGLITVRSEEEAKRYPIAPGNSVMFKVEGQPIIYEKIMGFSQLDNPSIKRYRLVEDAEVTEADGSKDEIMDAITELRKEIAELKKEEA